MRLSPPKTMRTFFICLAMSVLVACGGPEPSDAVKEFVEAMSAGNVDNAVDMVHIPSVRPDAMLMGKARLTMMFSDGLRDLDRSGGITAVDIIETISSEDGNAASVKYRMTLGNGETIDDEMDVVLVDGKWMINLG